jgi:hypothetical protein
MSTISAEKCSTKCNTLREAIDFRCIACLFQFIQKEKTVAPRDIQKIALLSGNYNETDKEDLNALLYLLDKLQEFFPWEFEEAYIFHTVISDFAPLYFVKELYYMLKDVCPSFNPREESSSGILPLAAITTSNLKAKIPEAKEWTESQLSEYLKKYMEFLLLIGANPNDLLDVVNGATVIYMSLYVGDWIAFKLLFPYVFPHRMYCREEYDADKKIMVRSEQSLMQFIIEEGYDEVFSWIVKTQRDVRGNVIGKPMIVLGSDEEASLQKIGKRKEEKYKNIMNAYERYMGSL